MDYIRYLSVDIYYTQNTNGEFMNITDNSNVQLQQGIPVGVGQDLIRRIFVSE